MLVNTCVCCPVQEQYDQLQRQLAHVSARVAGLQAEVDAYQLEHSQLLAANTQLVAQCTGLNREVQVGQCCSWAACQQHTWSEAHPYCKHREQLLSAMHSSRRGVDAPASQTARVSCPALVQALEVSAREGNAAKGQLEEAKAKLSRTKTRLQSMTERNVDTLSMLETTKVTDAAAAAATAWACARCSCFSATHAACWNHLGPGLSELHCQVSPCSLLWQPLLGAACRSCWHPHQQAATAAASLYLPGARAAGPAQRPAGPAQLEHAELPSRTAQAAARGPALVAVALVTCLSRQGLLEQAARSRQLLVEARGPIPMLVLALALCLSSSCVLVREVVLSWRAACQRTWRPWCATGSWSAWLRNSSRCVPAVAKPAACPLRPASARGANKQGSCTQLMCMRLCHLLPWQAHFLLSATAVSLGWAQSEDSDRHSLVWLLLLRASCCRTWRSWQTSSSRGGRRRGGWRCT